MGHPAARYAPPTQMDIIGSPSGRPFRYQGKLYQITSYGITGGVPHATVMPPNDQLVAEICRRLMRDGTLATYVGFDADHFPDDPGE